MCGLACENRRRTNVHLEPATLIDCRIFVGLVPGDRPTAQISPPEASNLNADRRFMTLNVSVAERDDVTWEFRR
jgi:hypothetical protein